jgi:alpha-D-ribose 1-methylphosphonate 5-triphosphate synthase subunit PhnL
MLSVESLSKEFIIHIRKGLRIPSFAGVSFTVAPGSLLAVTGPSGIGKSSLLKCIYRTYLPTAGRALYETGSGKTLDLAAAGDWEILALRRAEMGYVSQFFHVMPRVSMMDILTEPLTARGMGKEDARERAADMLSRAGLSKTLWEMYPATFSGGEKQRLNILRAIITKPRFLLLDEPTASLDKGYKNKIMDMILELKREGTAMIGVFHDRDALLTLSDTRYDLTSNCVIPVDDSGEVESINIDSGLLL